MPLGARAITATGDGHVGHIELLNADLDVDLLEEAARRFDLDAEGLRAAAQDLALENQSVPTGVTRPSG